MRFRFAIGFALLCVAVNSGFAQPSSNYDTYQSTGTKLTPLESRGRDTWYFWTAGDQNLWRKIAIITNGVTDLLLYVDSRRNGSRFRDLGVITEPSCQKATQPDEYGLWFDQCESENLADIPGQPSGVWVCVSSPILLSINRNGRWTSICRTPEASSRPI